MTTLADALRYQTNYALWATARVLNAATALSLEERRRDFGTADKSVEGTLIHLFRSERTWLARLLSPSNTPPSQLPTDTWSVIVEQWPALHQQWYDWAKTFTDESLNVVHEYQDSRGNSRRNALWVIVLHIVNHGTHHRGQVSGFLRALGSTPPSLDAIGYARELGI